MKNTGSSLEKIILASQRNIVTLTQIPSGVRWVGKGRTVPVAAPVDFFGGFVASGRLLVFDAKSDGNAKSLNTSDTHLKPHQRAGILRYGEAGFVAGILAEATKLRRYYWCDWRWIGGATAIAWASMLDMGPATLMPDWMGLEATVMMWDRMDFNRMTFEQAATVLKSFRLGESIYPEAK